MLMLATMSRLTLVVAALALAACSPQAGNDKPVPLPQSGREGQLDAAPPSYPDDLSIPPVIEKDGKLVPDERAPQAEARRILSAVADEVRFHHLELSFLSNAEFHEFATAPRSAGSPGLCEVDVLAVTPGYEGGRTYIAAFKRFAVVGSLAPLSDMWNKQYGARLTALCAKSKNVHRWFRAENDSDAWYGARAIDAAVHAARAAGRLPFEVSCVRPTEGKSRCEDARRTLASIEPRAITAVEAQNCSSGEMLECLRLTVKLNKDPRLPDTKDEDLWVVSTTVTLPGSASDTNIRLGRVEVEDVYEIVE